MVYITSNAAFLDCYTHVESLMVRVIISSMNPFIEDSFVFTSTASVSACNIISEVCR